jgi:DNA-directed RNA polymerase subunit RPC12/RpoP
VCLNAVTDHKLHYACVTCRVSFKRHPTAGRRHPCPNCGSPLACAGHDFAPPPRRDVRGWSVVAAVLGEGLRYEGRTACGCGKEPRYRPRTRAELRARRAVAAREGLPLSETLSRPDPQAPSQV